MSLKAALELAKKGFHVFPCAPFSKLPAIDDFPHAASRDPEQIRKWWLDPVMEIEQPYNVGISTTRFGDNEALVVVDVDNKEGKDGDGELRRLEKDGKILPPTLVQHTPTGGRHLIYRTPAPLRQGTDVLGRGLDIRSRGGFILGNASRLEAGTYTAVARDLGAAPEWLLQDCGRSAERDKPARAPAGPRVDEARSEARAIHFLTQEAPLAVEGDAGDQTTFKVACRVKDLGCSEALCFELMTERWNPMCLPPWSSEELKRKVENAYSYGESPVGVADPAHDFAPLPGGDAPQKPDGAHPFDVLNREYAYILTGGRDHILRETKDHRGHFQLQHLDIDAFHRKVSHIRMEFGGRNQAVSKLWISDERRRSYDGLCFLPGKKAPRNFYNLWRGFSVERLERSPTAQEQDSLDAFLEHAKVNVCLGDEELHRWLISYFAHLIQKPWERPLVALVMRGKKGVGKNALVERVGFLLSDHFAVVSNRRHLTGNFNSLLENKLLLTFDEAFWSGDKAAEGVLKDLITGEYHQIERKGKEPYKVENRLRVVILGNEEWLVPATEDERRYAVFNVGDGRMQDRKFFREMREGMEAGGYRLLLQYLQDFKIEVDVTEAPATDGLADQKLQSLRPLHQWWQECLLSGEIAHSGIPGWPVEVERNRFRQAFITYLRERNIGGWVSSDTAIGRQLREALPSVGTARRATDGGQIYCYRLPTLEVARKQWNEFIGHETKWDEGIETEEEIFK